MIDFTKITDVVIPEGNVIKIANSTNTLWEKVLGRIPSEYQEVEWIRSESSIGAYLDLGFTFDTKATIELSQYMETDATAYTFGAAENSGKLRCMFTSPLIRSSGVLYSYWYGSTGSAYNERAVPYLLNTWNYLKAGFQKGSLTVSNETTGDTLVLTTQSEYTMTNNLYLLGQNYNGTPRFGGVRQIGYFRYYNKNNELICDLVPCYRKSDGVIGMYDIVRKIFLTNVGSGSFTKGADVNV